MQTNRNNNSSYNKLGLLFFFIGVAGYFLITDDLPFPYLKAKYANGASHFSEVENTITHYRIEPPKLAKTTETILLIHGTSSSLHTWEGWVPELVSKGYRVIRLDLPGSFYSLFLLSFVLFIGKEEKEVVIRLLVSLLRLIAHFPSFF